MTSAATVPWHWPIRVEFNHCDPAGIMFYPRYFEMTNSVCENFFREVAGMSYAAMMADRTGTPCARIDAEFHRPSRLGDLLDWRLFVERVGNASAAFRLECWFEGEHRITARPTLVWVGADGRSRPWPDTIRACLLRQMEARQETA